MFNFILRSDETERELVANYARLIVKREFYAKMHNYTEVVIQNAIIIK